MKKKINFLGQSGMFLTIVGFTGLTAAEPSWYNFYVLVLIIAVVFLIIANILLSKSNEI